MATALKLFEPTAASARLAELCDFLDAQAVDFKLKAGDLATLEKEGITLINAMDAHSDAALPPLRARFLFLQGRRALADRDFGRAAWHLGSVEPSSAWREVSFQALVLLGDAFLRLGAGPRAEDAYDEAEVFAAPEDRSDLRLRRVRLLRVSGRSFEAVASLRLASQTDVSEWQAALTDAARGDLLPMLRLVDARSGSRTTMRLLEAFLWTRGQPLRRFDPKAPRPTAIRRLAQGSMKEQEAERQLYEVVRDLEQAVDPIRPEVSRLFDFADLAKRLLLLPDVEHELLCLAVAIRSFKDAELGRQTMILVDRYTTLSRSLSGEATSDVLGLFSREQEAAAPRKRGRPKSNAADLFFFGQLGAKASVALVQGKLRKWLGGEEEADGKAVAKVLAEAGARRKGVLLKLGQLASFADGILGDALKAEFEVVQGTIDPMPLASTHEVFERTLGRKISDCFAAFEEQPIATGSIGQVHRARLADGRVVAVKIQYPETPRLIELDMRRARMLKPFVLKRFPALNFDEIVAELGDHMLKETDYVAEAGWLEKFRGWFANDPMIHAPEVVQALSGSRVLTMEMCEGVSLKEFKSTAGQAERNAAGEALVRAFYTSLYQIGSFNADVQPGNFLFAPNGKVTFLDFGCVKSVNREFMNLHKQIQRATLANDAAGVVKAFKRLGYCDDSEVIDEQRLLEFYKIIWAEYVPGGPVRWNHAMVEAKHSATANHPFARVLKLPRDYVLQVRIDWGLHPILAELEAEVDMRKIVDRFL